MRQIVVPLPQQPAGVLPPSAYGEPEQEPTHPPAPRPDPSHFTADTDFQVRCPSCSKLLIEFATRPYSVRCARCKAVLTRLPLKVFPRSN